ncbi:MAG: TIR domain-containing protein [Gammaproteobacteria bacterium]|jgi:WD40 repeat protein
MNEIFISYARENKDFVRRLYDALNQAEHKSWVDWEGIPPSAEWFREISSAIESAQAFIFVISPDSVASRVCQQEIAHAVENNKRLIPIVYEEAEESQVPQALGKLNWVFFREHDDFNSALKILIEAIDTDLEWVGGHTRLLVRAREWDNKRRDKSLTLRGSDLREAEEWLTKGPEKEPKPTGLQTQYIIASRKAATKRQTITLTAILFGFVVALVLAGVAYYQYTVSEERRKIALSRQLAAQAVNHLDDQLDTAMLLSVEAYRTRNTIEARRTLYNAVQHNPRLTTFLHGHTAGVLSLAISPDGATLASSGWDNTIRFWNIATHQPIGAPYSGHNNYVRSVAFSPDGKLLASGSCAKYTKHCEQGVIYLIDVNTRLQTRAPLSGHTNWVYSVAFSPDGKLLASGSSDNTVRLWDVATGQPVGQPLTGHQSWVVSVTFSPDGKLLASASWDKTIRLWDVATGQSHGPPITGHTSSLTDVAFGTKGKVLASSSSDGTVRLWDVATGQALGKPLSGHDGTVNSVIFSPDGETLLSASADESIIPWDIESRQSTAPPLTGHTNEVLSLAICPDGNTVVSGDRDGNIIVWNLGNYNPLAQPLAHDIAPVSSIVYTPQETLVSLGGRPMDRWDERLTVWDATTRQALRHFDINTSILNEALSPDGRILATSSRSKNASGESTVTLWDAENGGRMGTPLTGKAGYITSLAVDWQSRRLATGNEDGTIAIWNLATHQTVGLPLSKHTGRVTSMAFSPDGRTLASGGEDQTVRFWDITTQSMLGEPLTEFPARIAHIVYSADGQLLAAISIGKTSSENAIVLWDANTHKMLGAPLTGQIGSGALTFSADGTMLASANIDGTVTLFDVHSRLLQPFSPYLSGHTSSTNAVAFSPSSPRLASGGGNISSGMASGGMPHDGSIVLWDLNIESWINRACRRANRNLSSQGEWKQLIGDEPYRRTCSD